MTQARERHFKEMQSKLEEYETRLLEEKRQKDDVAEQDALEAQRQDVDAAERKAKAAMDEQIAAARLEAASSLREEAKTKQKLHANAVELKLMMARAQRKLERRDRGEGGSSAGGSYSEGSNSGCSGSRSPSADSGSLSGCRRDGGGDRGGDTARDGGGGRRRRRHGGRHRSGGGGGDHPRRRRRRHARRRRGGGGDGSRSADRGRSRSRHRSCSGGRRPSRRALEAFRDRYPMDDTAFGDLCDSSVAVVAEVLRVFNPKDGGKGNDYSRLVSAFARSIETGSKGKPKGTRDVRDVRQLRGGGRRGGSGDSRSPSQRGRRRGRSLPEGRGGRGRNNCSRSRSGDRERSRKGSHSQQLLADLDAFRDRYPMDDRAFEFLSGMTSAQVEEVLRVFKPKTEGDSDYSGLVTSFLRGIAKGKGRGKR